MTDETRALIEQAEALAAKPFGAWSIASCARLQELMPALTSALREALEEGERLRKLVAIVGQWSDGAVDDPNEPECHWCYGDPATGLHLAECPAAVLMGWPRALSPPPVSQQEP